MTTRESLHELLDEVPESFLPFAEDSLLRVKQLEEDPFWRALADAPVDDEPTTAEDLIAIERGRASMREGRGISSDELERMLDECQET